MNKVCLSIVTAAMLSGVTFAQTAETQAGASASQSTSLQADRSGAQAGSQTSAQSSSQSTVTGPEKSSAGASATNQLASGSSIHTTLEKPVDSRKCKPGDEVIAKSTQNVKSDGKVVIPKGSKMVGHVTQVQTAGKGQSASQVGIAFDHAILKDGQQVPLHASIQAIAASQQSASAEMMGDGMEDGGMAGGGAIAGGRAAAGGTGSLVGGATRGVGAGGGTLVNTAGSATGGTQASLTGAGGALNSSGQLLSSSHGVVGLRGLSLDSASGAAAEGSVITSKTGNLHLDSGTQMILQVVAK